MLQSKYIFSIKRPSLQSKKTLFNQRKKVFECKNIVETQKNAFEHCFSLIENVFFDRSKGFLFEATFLIEVMLFCVWAILWVGHLCLYNSIKKEVASNKRIFSIKEITSIKKKNVFNHRKKSFWMQKNIWEHWIWTLFFIGNVFFDWSNIFCVWPILWVGHLCLNYSIPKKLL